MHLGVGNNASPFVSGNLALFPKGPETIQCPMQLLVAHATNSSPRASEFLPAAYAGHCARCEKRAAALCLLFPTFRMLLGSQLCLFRCFVW